MSGETSVNEKKVELNCTLGYLFKNDYDKIGKLIDDALEKGDLHDDIDVDKATFDNMNDSDVEWLLSTLKNVRYAKVWVDDKVVLNNMSKEIYDLDD